MSETTQVYGMVISSMPVGENDRRVVLLTRELGKISAFARGARRPGSALMAASNPPAFGMFVLAQGRSSYAVTQASIDNYFHEIASDPVGVYYAYYFLEFADYYGREGIDASEMLNLLYVSMKALLSEKLDDRLVRRVYELRLMTLNGEYAPPPAGLSESALYTVQYICGSPLEKLYTFAVTEGVLDELGKMMDGHMARMLDRDLKSRRILNEMIGEHGYGREN